MPLRTAELQAAWKGVAARHAGYRLVLPGEPRFICQPHSCDASCCRAFHIAVDGVEVARLERASGTPAARFLECEGGEPIVLPLAQPFVLGRREGSCLFLDGDLACEQYRARPRACRLYPHQVIFVDRALARAVRASREAGRRAVEAVVAGRALRGPLPLLLRHGECPGFTGPPSTLPEWAALFRETYALSAAMDGMGEDGAGEVVSSPP